MSTRLLERRMDLIHTFDDVNCINTLTMDTSYPARLSGIIIKVFKSVYKYTTLKINGESISDDNILFKIENESHESIVEIPKNKIFKFNNEPFENNGYKANEYILTIIDINNKTMLIHSVDGSSTETVERSVYERTLDYNCNGKNDNVILGDITNILIDLYKYNSDISFDTDEFKYAITNNEKKKIFRNGKFTINVVGNFGIDYSHTDFVYGGFNRQNRSSIMKISGVLPEDSTYKEEYNMDFEMVVDFSRCYIPEIKYNSNEKLAALYNTKLNREDSTIDSPVYYDYFNKTETAHFVDEDGNPYGNLFPRRLMFISVEGALPINLTIKNMSLTTFGVGVYCEVESNKTIKIIDSKIAICKSLDKFAYLYDQTDISNNQYFYARWASAIPLGCAVDINCYNANIIIDGCKFRNDSLYYGGDLVINSSKNMRITNSDILGFDQFSDSYKYAYTYQFLDYDFNPDCYYKETGESSYFNQSSEATIKDRFTEEQMKNVNFIDLEILRVLFYTKYSYPSKRVIRYNTLTNTGDYDKDFIMNKANKLYSLLDPTDITTAKNDKCTRELLNISSTETMKFKTISLFSTISSLTNCVFSTEGAGGSSADEPISLTCGVIKNIPIMFKNAYWDLSSRFNNYNLLYDKDNNPVQMLIEEHPNQDSMFRPIIFISDSKIESDGLIYQSGGHIHVNNCLLKSKLYDYFYQSCQINIISGEVTLNNCECDFNTVGTRFGMVDMNWIGKQYNRPASFIRLAPSFTASMFSVLEKLGLAFNPASFTIADLFNIYGKMAKIMGYNENGLGGFEYIYSMYGTAVKVFTSPKLNMSNTSITTHVDFRFNLLNSAICNISYGNLNDTTDFTNLNEFLYTHNIDSKGNKEYFLLDTEATSPKLSIVYSANQSTADYFNPFIDPKININGCNFYINNNFSRGEFDAVYDNVDNENDNSGKSSGTLDFANREVLNIIVRMGKNVITSVNDEANASKICTGSFASISGKDIIGYVNILIRYITTAGELESAIGKVPKYKFEKNRYYYIIFFDLTNNIRTDALCYDNEPNIKPGTNYKILNFSQETFEISSDTTVYNKLMIMKAYNYYEFFKQVGYLYTDIGLYNTYNEHHLSYGGGSDEKFLYKQDFDDYVIITSIKGTDLPNTGLYTKYSFREYAKMTYMAGNTRPFERFTTTGVVAFQLQNCTLNMDNCNIGGMTESALGNTYNSEILLKRSPRIAFQLSNSGLYKISNSNIYAWANVIWSDLNTSMKEVFDYQYNMFNTGGYENLSLNDISEKTTVDLNKSGCIINNCNLLNYNAIRYNYSNEYRNNMIFNLFDDYKKALINVENDSDKYSQNITFFREDDNQKPLGLNVPFIRSNLKSNLEYLRYNEAFRSCNEIPIIVINHLDNNVFEINHSNIKGNEIFILAGNMQINNSFLLNNSNALLVYLHEYNNVTEAPSLSIKNSKLTAVKDVIFDSYIDKKKRRFESYNLNGISYDNYYEETFYDDRRLIGSINADDNVIAIYGGHGNNITLENNNIDFRCSSYDDKYGLIEPTKVRFIYAKTSFGHKCEINFKGNNVNTMFDGPFLGEYFKKNDTYGFLRSVHTSDYYSLIQTDFYNQYYRFEEFGNVFIENNTFNMYSLFNDYCTYLLKLFTSSDIDINNNGFINYGNAVILSPNSTTDCIYKTNLGDNKLGYFDYYTDYYFTLNTAEYGYRVKSISVKRTHEYFKNPLLCYSETGIYEYNTTTDYKRVVLNPDSPNIENLYKLIKKNSDGSCIFITKFANFDYYNETQETDKYSYDINTLTITITPIDKTMDDDGQNPIYIIHSLCNNIQNSLNDSDNTRKIIFSRSSLYNLFRVMYKGFSTPVFYAEDKFASNVYMHGNTFNNGGFYVGSGAFDPNLDEYKNYVNNNTFCKSYNDNYTNSTGGKVFLSYDSNVYTTSTGNEKLTDFETGFYNYTVVDKKYRITINDTEYYINPSEIKNRFYVLNNSTIFDIKLNIMDLNDKEKLNMIKKKLRYNTPDVISNTTSSYYNVDNYTCADEYPNVLDISNNKFIGNRSQAYYDKVDKDNKYSRRWRVTTSYTDPRITNPDGSLMTLHNEYIIFKRSGNLFSVSNDLRTYAGESTNNSYGNIVNTNYNFYNTITNCGMLDQADSAYTFTNSFAIQMEMQSRHALIDSYNYTKYLLGTMNTSINLGVNTADYVYQVYTSNTSYVNPASRKRITELISSDVIDKAIYRLSNTTVYYNSKEKTDDGYYSIRYSTNDGATWKNLGYLHRRKIIIGYYYSIDFESLQLFEPINGNVITYDNRLGNHCEGFLTKVGNSMYAISSEGSKYTPNIHLNNSIGSRIPPLKFTLNNNTCIYNNMNNMFPTTRGVGMFKTIPVNKKNILRMLRDVYGNIK